jgi:hypothetical protein
MLGIIADRANIQCQPPVCPLRSVLTIPVRPHTQESHSQQLLYDHDTSTASLRVSSLRKYRDVSFDIRNWN